MTPPRLALSPLPLLFLALFAWSPVAAGAKNEPPDDKEGGAEKEKPPKQESASECVKHTVQARFISGYDHLVHLTNGCSRAAICQVSTDVNPEPQSVSLAVGASATVLTFRGSPARTFRAKVDCAFQGAPH